MSTDSLKTRLRRLECADESQQQSKWALMMEYDSQTGESIVINDSEAAKHLNPPTTIFYFPKKTDDHTLKGNV